MLALFVLSLMAGFGLGLRLMLGGVLKDTSPVVGEGPAQAARRRAQARLVTPMAAAVLASFGLTGAVLVRGAGWSATASLVTALGAAAVSAALAALVRSWALDPNAPADPEEDPRFVVQGLPALVTRAIAAARSGEITWRMNGRTEVTPARALDGAELREGTEVVIDRLEDGIAWVETWRQVEARL
jgi:hypothetical protein